MNRLFRLSLIVLTALGTTFPSAGLAQAVDSPTRSTPYKIAIFSIENDRGNSGRNTRISDDVTNFIRSDSSFTLVYSFYSDGYSRDRVPKTDKLWVGGAVRKKPNLALLYAIARKLGVDGVVMAFHEGYGLGSPDAEGWTLELYLIGVDRQQVHYRKGRMRDTRTLIRGVFADFAKSRPQVVATAPPAGAATQPAPTTNPAKYVVLPPSPAAALKPGGGGSGEASALLAFETTKLLMGLDKAADAGCSFRRITDRKLVTVDRQLSFANDRLIAGRWREQWSVDRCGTAIVYDLVYTADGKGGVFIQQGAENGLPTVAAPPPRTIAKAAPAKWTEKRVKTLAGVRGQWRGNGMTADGQSYSIQYVFKMDGSVSYSLSGSMGGKSGHRVPGTLYVSGGKLQYKEVRDLLWIITLYEDTHGTHMLRGTRTDGNRWQLNRR